MKLNNVSPLTLANDNMMINDFGYQPTPTYYQPTYNSSSDFNEPIAIVNTGSSQVLEPVIITPINSQPQTTSTTGSFITDTGEVLAPIPPKGTGGFKDTETTEQPLIKDDKVNSEPSATTDKNKTYVNGGTTPDSNIYVKKSKPNYIVYGVVGIIGLLVVYKVFLEKK